MNEAIPYQTLKETLLQTGHSPSECLQLRILALETIDGAIHPDDCPFTRDFLTKKQKQKISVADFISETQIEQLLN